MDNCRNPDISVPFGSDLVLCPRRVGFIGVN